VVTTAVSAGSAAFGVAAGPLTGHHGRWNDGGMKRLCIAAAGGMGVLGAGYLGLVTGVMPVDLGVGRRVRPLGPFGVDIGAGQEAVFDILSRPYLGRQTRAMAEKIQILERGNDMVLAAHRTAVRGRLVAVTVETVRFTPPDRIDFRLVRGPVPQVTEAFLLSGQDGRTRVDYSGELGADLWALGQAWAAAVAARWERVVMASLDAVRAEAERRPGPV
ncbi:MAG: hypothetical protein ACRDNF_03795, partial [Streptosporangiaceae bacterium]